MALTLVTGPTVEPISLDEARAHVRLGATQTDDDQYLAMLIPAVRLRAERATRRALLTQTWDLFLDQWPTWDGYHGGQTWEPSATSLPAGGWIWLPKAPLQSVTFIKYIDLSGTQQTWATTEYAVDAPAGDYAARGRVSLKWVKVWPVIQPIANAVQIRMVCGYGATADAIPALLKQAMLLDMGTLYDIRSSVLAGSRAASIEISSTSKDIYRSFKSW